MMLLLVLLKYMMKDDFFNPNIVKMVSGENNNLLYASRSPIPITKDKKYIKAHKHLPLYAFNRDELDLFYKRGQKSKTYLEGIEDVEILRFLELGISVKTISLYDESVSVDIPSDLDKVLIRLR
jgi:3-deoxy-manno-octulosonate cytidylyltransferase (CMP-KDO synthetase)